MKITTLSVIALACASSAMAQKNLPPTMGWSSWNTYAAKISESIIKGQADAMVKSGLDTCGYKYINIDDGFQKNRDANGNLIIDGTRFPNGLKPVVDYIHGKGLKAGIYSDAGHNTCASFYGGETGGVGVGLLDHEAADCKLYFNDLGFDFIKVDFCGGNASQNSENLALDPKTRYESIAKSIEATGCDVQYNVCRWAFPGTWVMDIADSWRVTEDIYDAWKSVKGIIEQNLYLSAYCKRGHYNDMDMLEVGRSMTQEEDKTHFGMWCIMDSPLMIGCDISNISDATRKLLGNTELIALNQDTLGLQAYVVQHSGDTYVLVKDINERHGKTRAVAFYNPSDVAATMSIPYVDLDLGGKVKVRDLLEQKDVEDAPEGTFSVTVPAHGTRIYKMEGEKRYERALYEAETAYLTDYQELLNNQSAKTAIYDAMTGASGGTVAGWLGCKADNDLQWKDVYSKDGGNYTMTLSYISGADRKTIISVNGTDVATKTLNSGGWSTIKTIEIPVTLKAGENIIRLYTDGSDWMPNFDYMTIYKEGSTDKDMRTLESAKSNLNAILNSNLTPAMTEKIKSLLATDTTGMSSTDISSLASNMSSTLTTAKAMVANCDTYLAWKKNAEQNISVSAESTALTTLRSNMEKAQTAYDTALTNANVSTALTSLKTALTTYLKAEDAEPQTGESLDMTLLLTNPDFSLSTGWIGSPTYNYGVGEFWNKTFSLYQSLSGLKNGNYTITANALYRTAQNDGGTAYKAGTENIPARLYANKDSISVSSIYSSSFYDQTSGWSDVDVKQGYCNSMYTASLMFSNGYYNNEVKTTVTDGKLKVGIISTSSVYDCWCCFDNFHISYQPSDTSGILSVSDTKSSNDSQTIYNISGQKVPTSAKGLVIKNHKAIIIK